MSRRRGRGFIGAVQLCRPCGPPCCELLLADRVRGVGAPDLRVADVDGARVVVVAVLVRFATRKLVPADLAGLTLLFAGLGLDHGAAGHLGRINELSADRTALGLHRRLDLKVGGKRGFAAGQAAQDQDRGEQLHQHR